MPAETTIPVIKPEKRPKRSSRKLLFLLIVFFMMLLVILFFQSSISKVATIDISGNEFVSADDILQASGVAVGDHFFAVSLDKLKKNVKALKMIDSVEAGKIFPGVVKIRVKEYPRVAFQMASDGTKEALLADGSAVPVVGGAAKIPFDMPILTNWAPDDPLKIKLCGVLANIPPHLLSDISEIKPVPSEAYADKIKLYTRSKFEVYTTIDYLADRIEYLGFIINEMKDRGNSSGIITMLETVRFSPFEGQGQAADGSDAGKGKSKDQLKDSDSGKKDTAKESTPPKTKESVRPSPARP